MALPQKKPALTGLFFFIFALVRMGQMKCFQLADGTSPHFFVCTKKRLFTINVLYIFVSLNISVEIPKEFHLHNENISFNLHPSANAIQCFHSGSTNDPLSFERSTGPGKSGLPKIVNSKNQG